MRRMPRVTTAVATVWPFLLLVCLVLTASAHLQGQQASVHSGAHVQQEIKHRTQINPNSNEHHSQHARFANRIHSSDAAAVAGAGTTVTTSDGKQQLQNQRKLFAEAAVLPQITIPVPPPGADIPKEPLVPLYSPDQLRLRLPIIPGVPLDGQIISIMEQMQQAAVFNKTLTPEQLQYANPILGKHGILKLPARTAPHQYPEGYVAICAIVKDQHKDLREWLEYHKFIGVSKVYIYDNNSTEPLTSAIRDYMHSGYVEYAFFTGQPRYRDLFRTSSQWWAYNDCISRYRHRHRWLAFIDADEFIVFQDNSTDINTFMQAYDKYGGLAINWVVFGSSGHKQRPVGGVLVNYRQCLPLQQEQNQHVKVIANTAHLMTAGDDPHRVYYNNERFFTVNELGQRVDGPKSPPTHTKIALFHYLTKSEGEFMLKMKRGSAAGNYKAPEFFYAINGLANSTCTRAVPLGLKCCPSVLVELGPAGVKRVQQELLQHQQLGKP